MSQNVSPFPLMPRVAEALNEQPDRAKLEQYVLDESNPELGQMACSLFTLVHKSGDDDCIQSWIIPRGASDDERRRWASRIGAEADEWARNTASTCPFKQSFRLTATIGRNPADAPKGGYPFVATPPPEKARGFKENAGYGAHGNALDPNSVIGALTRQSDTIMRMFAETMQGVVDRQAQEIAEERVTRMSMMERIEAMWRERETLRDQAAERDIRVQNQLVWSNLLNDLQTEGLPFVKALTNKWLEGKGIAGLAKTLKAEQVMMLFASAKQDPEQKKALKPLVQPIMDAMEPAEAQRLAELMGMSVPAPSVTFSQVQPQAPLEPEPVPETPAPFESPEPGPAVQPEESPEPAPSVHEEETVAAAEWTPPLDAEAEAAPTAPPRKKRGKKGASQ